MAFVEQELLCVHAGVYGCTVLAALVLKTSSITSIWQVVSLLVPLRWMNGSRAVQTEGTKQTIRPAPDLGHGPGLLGKVLFTSLELFGLLSNLTWVADGPKGTGAGPLLAAV